MKKLIQSVLCILLVCSMLCGCSLLKKDSDSETDTISTTEVTETVAVRTQWGPGFEAEGTQQQVAYTFVSSVFPDTWTEQFECETQVEMIKWGIGEGSEDDLIRVYVNFAVFAEEPTEKDTALLKEGNVQPGTDDYEGAFILTRYFYLEKKSEIGWECMGFGLSW